MQNFWEKIEKGTFIIAEAGKNFIQSQEERSVEEYLKNAMQLVDEAAAAAGTETTRAQAFNDQPKSAPALSGVNGRASCADKVPTPYWERRTTATAARSEPRRTHRKM